VPGAELEAIGVARHLAGDYAGAMHAYERAHAAYRREGDVLAAARAARTVGWFRGWVFGDWAVHRGWMGRARRLLDGSGPAGRQAGWRLLDAAQSGGDLEIQREQYEAVIEIARRHDDADLECEAQASLGMMLVFSGFVDAGMAHLDEALAALCAGDVEELPVLEGCLCGLFNACERTHDVRRAEQWLRAADDLMTRRKLVAVAGYCRAHYAGILISAGRWNEAEAELVQVIDSLPVGLAVRDGARCRLADLRVRQGRFEQAAELLTGMDSHEDAIRPLAELHLARGDALLALDVIERRLSSTDVEDYVEAPLLAVAIDAHLVLGDVGAADTAVARLDALARAQSSRYVGGLAAVMRARLCAVRGDGDRRRELHQALAMFVAAEMPFEVACTRLELARAATIDRPQVAITEATTALDAFQLLGADRHVDAAAALLRGLGAPARTGPKDRGVLTRREQEVLELLRHGLSNAELAERLFISPKTVEHHVGRILSKLGLHNRAEAAVFAVRASN
jgi:DNA-binding CsgD family transcriptional regulator